MGERPFPRWHQEWNLALAPRLIELGCTAYRRELPTRKTRSPRAPSPADARGGSQPPPVETTFFHDPTGEVVRVGLARTAKIKVRKFGSAYRVDPQRDFAERWRELDLAHTLRRLKKRDWHELDLVLFIGFAREPEPFAAELEELRYEVGWDARGNVEYFTRWWADRYDRKFHVRVCVWVRKEEGTPSQ